MLLATLLFTTKVFAALYGLIGTDYLVNSLSANFTTIERAKLETRPIAKTDEANVTKKYVPLDRATAKAKIKQIVVAETSSPASIPAPEPTAAIPALPIGQTGLRPIVDISKNISPAEGYNDLRIRPTSEQPRITRDSAFRISCVVSHMSNDDPMVYPGQEGASHHHTFYGNTQVRFDTDLSQLSTTGNSTCDGGIMNRSAYWHPTIINTLTNAPVLPDQGAIFYYKVGHPSFGGKIKPPPIGLRILAGNSKATTFGQSKASKYVCINIAMQHSNGMKWQSTIPHCGPESFMQQVVLFPQCWDGKNLDSPNHQDHMAYPRSGSCPATHPVPIPEISLNLNYKVHADSPMNKWRLASDNYTFNGRNAGYSGHADWVNGWDEKELDGIVKNCLNARKDCHAHLLGDGRMFYRD
jgi:hypothetical protein